MFDNFYTALVYDGEGIVIDSMGELTFDRVELRTEDYIEHVYDERSVAIHTPEGVFVKGYWTDGKRIYTVE